MTRSRSRFNARTSALASLAMFATAALAGVSTAGPALGAITPTNASATASNNSSQTTQVRVAPGLTPRSIRGRINAPESLTGDIPRQGTVTVTAGGQRVYSGPAREANFNTRLTTARVANGVLPVTLTYSVPSLRDDFCAANDQQISLDRVRVNFGGTQAAPTSVANFLPPGVNAVNVLLPANPSTDLISAGLSAVGAATYKLESNAQVRMSLGTLDPRITRVPGARVIALTEGANPVATSITSNAELPQLNLSGSGVELAQAASALGGAQLPIAGAARTQGLSQEIQPTIDLTQSFKSLGADNPNLSGWGTQSLFVGVDQSSFGAGISDVNVRLVGTHTAIPANVTSTLNVYWNDNLIASEVLDATTDLDIRASVPNINVQPQNGLRITLTSVPNNGDCSGSSRLIPMNLSLDSDLSQVVTTRGQTIPSGFERFPQAFGGNLPVAFGEGTSTQQAAVQASLLVASLQRVNQRQLAVKVVPLSEVVGTSTSALVVGADSTTSNDLSSPLRLEEFRSLASSNLEFGVGIDIAYAALQAFATGNRNLIMLGSWAPNESVANPSQQLEMSLAEMVYSQGQGWNSLGTDILLAQPNQAPVQIDSNTVIPQPAVTSEYSTVLWWVILVILLFFGLGLWRYLSVRRTRRKVTQYVDAQEEADRANEDRITDDNQKFGESDEL